MASLGSKLPDAGHERVGADFSLATVNIVLLLVFFFLITGTLVQRDEMSVDLAETKDLPLDRLPRPLLLMRADGHWSLDGTEVTAGTLLPALDADLQSLPGAARVLHLLPDRHLPAAELIAILQRPDLANVQIQLVTLRLRAVGQ